MIAALALLAMLLVPIGEMAARPLMGRGIDNAPVLVQHLGLVLAMAGAAAAARRFELTTLLGARLGAEGPGQGLAFRLAGVKAALVCGLLAGASARFVATEREAGQMLAWSMPVWTWQAVMPAGFGLLGVILARQALAALSGRTHA